MKRRSFLRHAAAAIATVSIGARLQSPLPVLQDGPVVWNSWNTGAILNRGWKARVISGPPDFGAVRVTCDEHGIVMRAISAREMYAA